MGSLHIRERCKAWNYLEVALYFRTGPTEMVELKVFAKRINSFAPNL